MVQNAFSFKICYVCGVKKEGKKKERKKKGEGLRVWWGKSVGKRKKKNMWLEKKIVLLVCWVQSVIF